MIHLTMVFYEILASITLAGVAYITTLELREREHLIDLLRYNIGGLESRLLADEKRIILLENQNRTLEKQIKELKENKTT